MARPQGQVTDKDKDRDTDKDNVTDKDKGKEKTKTRTKERTRSREGQGKARQGKARQGKARQGKSTRHLFDHNAVLVKGMQKHIPGYGGVFEFVGVALQSSLDKKTTVGTKFEKKRPCG